MTSSCNVADELEKHGCCRNKCEVNSLACRDTVLRNQCDGTFKF